MSRLLSFAILLILPILAAAQRTHPKRQPIIDVHLHNYSTDELLKEQAPNPVTGKPNGLATEQAHMQATLKAMERYHIVKGVVSDNLEVGQRWKTTAPDRVIVSYGFDDPSSADLDVLRREVAAGRVLALGEIGNQYEGIPPNDPRMEPYFAVGEKLDIPFAIHMGLGPPGAAYIGYPKYRMGLSNPLLLEEVLIRHPKLRIYVMHAGWPMLDQMIGLMWAHPQVYVDIGVINWAIPRKEFHSYLRRLVDAGFGKRIMFGSDQMVWPEVIGRAIEGVESATFLTPEQKRDIFYNNAVEFFRLDMRVKAKMSSPGIPFQSKPLSDNGNRHLFEEGAIIRGDKSAKQLALVFTGDEFADGAETIVRVLKQQGVQASFFFTGRFYRNADFRWSIQRLKRDGHYLGAHSDEHLLYCDWNKRDELLVNRETFEDDLNKNYRAMRAFGISKNNARFFLPPFEWYNRKISDWTEGMGLRLINYTPGTRSNADYTTPEMKNYVSSEAIMQSIRKYESLDAAGLNGFILLMHIGVAPERKDKFYNRLDDLIGWLRSKEYRVVRIDQLLKAGSN